MESDDSEDDHVGLVVWAEWIDIEQHRPTDPARVLVSAVTTAAAVTGAATAVTAAVTAAAAAAATPAATTGAITTAGQFVFVAAAGAQFVCFCEALKPANRQLWLSHTVLHLSLTARGSSQQFSYNGTGTLPKTVNRLTSLKTFKLKEQFFSGTMPDFSNSPDLAYL